MITKVYKIDEENINMEDIKELGKLISQGELVAFPTETVYGLGANALDDKALLKIFKAKNRPVDNPLIIHISNKGQLENLVSKLPKTAELCMEKFWPGPLTLILNKAENISDILTGSLDTIAVRMPDNKIALEIIKESKLPIAAPSANSSGKPSPTEAGHVLNDLKGRISALVDGGRCSLGLESTVLDLTGRTPTILRPGAVTHKDLEELLGHVDIDRSIIEANSKLIPKSPGQKYRHYAPRADMILFQGEASKLQAKLQEKIDYYLDKGLRVGVLSTDETQSYYKGNISLKSMGTREDLTTIAHNLFFILRDLDKENIDIILAEAVEEEGIGLAIMNRLVKAASNQIIYV